MTEYRRIEIDKGVGLTIIGTDKFKTNYLSVSFICPLSEEQASKNALLPMVLKRGSKSFPDMESVSARLDSLYGASLFATVRKKGELQVSGLGLEFIGNDCALGGEDVFAGAMELLFDLMFNPRVSGEGFEATYTEQEKVNLRDLIAARINDKRAYAVNRCVEEMCRGEAYAVDEYGKAEQVQAITPQSLYEQYQALLSGGHIEISFVGKGGEALEARVRELTGQLTRSPSELPATQVRGTAESPREYVEELPVSQGKLTLGFRSGITAADPDYPAAVLFNAVYGGTPVSKLFMNVREKLSLCYYCSSRLEKLKGLMLISSGIEVENREKAQQEILAQLEAVKKGDFSDEELENARRSMVNAFNSSADSIGALEDWHLNQMLAGSPKTLEDAAKEMAWVKREDVVRVAEKMRLDMTYFLKGTK